MMSVQTSTTVVVLTGALGQALSKTTTNIINCEPVFEVFLHLNFH